MTLEKELVGRFPELYVSYASWGSGKIEMKEVPFRNYDPEFYGEPDHFIIKINFEKRLGRFS